MLLVDEIENNNTKEGVLGKRRLKVVKRKERNLR